MAEITWTVVEIVTVCGGASAVGARLGLSRDAPYKWKDCGIDWHYWKTLVEMSGGKFEPMDIYLANLATLKPKGK